jgi:hypothetical protein
MSQNNAATAIDEAKYHGNPVARVSHVPGGSDLLHQEGSSAGRSPM